MDRIKCTLKNIFEEENSEKEEEENLSIYTFDTFQTNEPSLMGSHGTLTPNRSLVSLRSKAPESSTIPHTG